MGVFSALQATILEEARLLLPPSFPLGSFQRGLSLFSKPYLYYRSFRFLSFIQQPQDVPTKNAAAIKGAALHLLSDFTTIGNYALQIALIAKCAEDLIQEYRKLGDCYQQLRQTVYWQYPSYEPIKKKEISALPPWLILRKKELQSLIGQMRRIIQAVGEILRQGCRLSIRLYEAYLLFNGDQQVQYEGCVELIAEWNRYQDQLQNNYQRLIEELQKGSKLADRIFIRLGKPAKTEEIIEKLRQSFNHIGNISSDWIKDCKQAAVETLDSVYIDGKMTPLHINFQFKPKSPHSLSLSFPAWAGQQLPKPPPSSPMSPIFSSTKSNPLSKFTTCFKKVFSPPSPLNTQSTS